MGLQSAMTTALTGLQAAETTIDVVGNNVANSNTAGFKESNVLFATQFLQTQSIGSGPTTSSGGTNPRQIGLGVDADHLVAFLSEAGGGNSPDMAAHRPVESAGIFAARLPRKFVPTAAALNWILGERCDRTVVYDGCFAVAREMVRSAQSFPEGGIDLRYQLFNVNRFRNCLDLENEQPLPVLVKSLTLGEPEEPLPVNDQARVSAATSIDSYWILRMRRPVRLKR